MWKISCVWKICCSVLLEKRKCGKVLCLANDVGVTWCEEGELNEDLSYGARLSRKRRRCNVVWEES